MYLDHGHAECASSSEEVLKSNGQCCHSPCGFSFVVEAKQLHFVLKLISVK